MTSLPLDSRDLALDLYGLLRELDAFSRVRTPRPTPEPQLRARVSRIDGRITALLAASWAGGTAVRDRLVDLQALVHQYTPPVGAVDPRGAWRALLQVLQPAYERFADSLREWDVHVPALRPHNPARSLLHVASGAAVVVVVELWLYTQPRMLAVAGGAAAIAWLLEITRRSRPRWNDVLMRAFGPTSHPHERYRVNSATWYTTALAALAVLGSVPAGVVGVAVLAAADPFAALIGRRFGQVKLLHGRTLEGTLAFFGAAIAVAIGVLRGLHPEIALGAAVCMGAAAATAGAVAELLARRVDDNLAIPVVAGFAAWATGTALGAL